MEACDARLDMCLAEHETATKLEFCNKFRAGRALHEDRSQLWPLVLWYLSRSVMAVHGGIELFVLDGRVESYDGDLLRVSLRTMCLW